ncbi:MAG: hypothetical protein QHH00_06455 [Methanomassiliicoccales archaeon]|jgi:hypothetical protein|nr:hypothetical protein [Methanomassiliicoccales archaeon]
MRRVELNGTTINVLPVVKGLVSEESAVEKAFELVCPEVVGISISPEELEGLRRKEDYEKYEPSDLEIAYGNLLSLFGAVKIPPPCYVKALELSERTKTPLVAIDMDEEYYTEAYCNCIGTIDLLQESFFVRRLTRKKFDLSSPHNFVLDWDKKVNATSGFRKLLQMREQYMAERIMQMAPLYKKILAVVEYERANGIVANLERTSTRN